MPRFSAMHDSSSLDIVSLNIDLKLKSQDQTMHANCTVITNFHL